MAQQGGRQDSSELAGADFRREPKDFSLVLGGSLFQLFRKAHLAGLWAHKR